MVTNKYSKIYFNIMNVAKERVKPETYCEKHHILPKSLGGTLSKDNLVFLTAKEHYVAHHLLTKMYEGISKQKMDHAFWKLNSRYESENRIKINSRTFEISRKKQSELVSKQFTGRFVSESARESVRQSNKKRIGNNHPLWGTNRPDHVKESSRIANKGNKYCLGRIVPNETKKKMSESQLKREKFKCHYCDRQISGLGNLKMHTSTHIQ
jgi:5-methylcytosine-specific restriction endonuclease McrA